MRKLWLLISVLGCIMACNSVPKRGTSYYRKMKVMYVGSDQAGNKVPLKYNNIKDTLNFKLVIGDSAPDWSNPSTHVLLYWHFVDKPHSVFHLYQFYMIMPDGREIPLIDSMQTYTDLPKLWYFYDKYNDMYGDMPLNTWVPRHDSERDYWRSTDLGYFPAIRDGIIGRGVRNFDLVGSQFEVTFVMEYSLDDEKHIFKEIMPMDIIISKVKTHKLSEFWVK